jgi:hypothetical protein
VLQKRDFEVQRTTLKDHTNKMDRFKNADFEEDIQFFLFGKYYVSTHESELYIRTKNNSKIVLKISSLQE